MSAPAEKWLAVGDVPGYEVSDQGRVRSIDRQVRYRDGRTFTYRGKVLQPATNPVTGYQHVSLRRTSYYVHRLVLAAFVGPPAPGQECRHGVGGPSDNRLQNLQYGTSSENTRDQIEHGTHVPGGPARAIGEPRREQCGSAYGYQIHRARREPSCQGCLDAKATYERVRAGGPLVKRAPKPCGTRAAYQRHLRRREKPCEACRTANSAEAQLYELRKLEAAA